MKYSILFLLPLFLFGCSDNISTSVSPPFVKSDTLLYSVDSLVISTEQIISIPDTTELYFPVYSWESPKLKAAFTGETNFDSIGGIQTVCANALSSVECSAFFACGQTQINGEHNFTCTASFGLCLKIIIYETYTTGYKYLKLKNIKIYRTYQ